MTGITLKRLPTADPLLGSTAFPPVANGAGGARSREGGTGHRGSYTNGFGGSEGVPRTIAADAATAWENWKGWDGQGSGRVDCHVSKLGAGFTSRDKVVAVSHLKHLTAGRKLTFKDFDLRPTVGTGTFGRVRVVKLRGSVDRAPMVLKIMKKSEVLRLKQVDHVIAEMRILSMIEHPFVVNLLTTFEDERRLFILLEFVNGGELFSHLRRKGRLPSDDAQFYSAEITLAIEYLHGMKVVYRDLKPENLLIDCDGHIKMTDFGFAKIVEDRTWTLCGTPEYLAPEIIQSIGHFHAVDWWALGILCFEMLAGFPPFYDNRPFGIYQKILAGRPEFPVHFSTRATSFIKALLRMDATQRLGSSSSMSKGAEDVKWHRWFKGLDWEVLLGQRRAAPYIPNVRAPDDTSMFDRYPESTEDSAPTIADKDNEVFAGFSLNA